MQNEGIQRVLKYMPREDLLLDSQLLRDDYNKFIRNLRDSSNPHVKERFRVAEKYLSGRGLEIGAFHFPNPLPKNCEADYLDQMSILEIKERFSDFNDMYCVFPIIIDNGEELSKVESESYDFLIANHMIEHTQNVFKTIQNHLRVLKPNGILMYTVPDKRYTFDKDRGLTSYEHLIQEYHEGSDKFQYDHYYDVCKNINKLEGEALNNMVNELVSQNMDTHFHVWTSETFIEHINRAIDDKILNIKVLDHSHNVDIESMTVMQKVI